MRRAAAPRSPDRTSARGFTLLEMLVVLAITGLITGLLYPQIETASFAIRQRIALEQMFEAAESARALALRSGMPATLGADQSGTGLTIAASADAGSATSRSIALEPSRQTRIALLPQRILFYPDGSTTGGQMVLGTGRDAATFEVDRANGQLQRVQRDSTLPSDQNGA